MENIPAEHRAQRMRDFSVETDDELSPWEATAKSRRLKVGWQARAITALSQGPYRAYLYPLFTPAGVAVTCEAPTDHPHHQSITIGTDHLHCSIPLPPLSFAPGRLEEATYNFWMDDTYLGRAPGRILGTSVQSTESARDRLRIVQSLEWRGPSEWGASDGRLVAEETRTIDVHPGKTTNTIDLRSQLKPTQWDIQIGPTLHAYFTIRMADGLRVADGGTLIDSHGRNGASQIRGHTADWVDCSGMAAHGRQAGIAVFPYPSAGDPPWHVSDWGTLAVNPFLVAASTIKQGEMLDVAVRIVAHDGDADEAGVADLFQSFATQIESSSNGPAT